MKARLILAAAAVILMFAGVCTGVVKVKKTGSDTEIITATQAPIQSSVTITAVGDCTFGTDIAAAGDGSFDSFAESYGTSYFFENVRDIFAEDDLTIVNFEGTLSEQGEREDKLFAFRGSPDYVNILTSSSVEAANMANNHSMDYGKISRTDTKNYLTEAGILNFRGKRIAYTEINGIKIALAGVNILNDVEKTYFEEVVRTAKANADLVILSVHWGEEKATEPNDEQKEFAHKAIDCGADLVLGTHPHVLQGIEKYNGKYIAYSLGNFCFGGNNNPSDKDSVIYRQTFTVNAGNVSDDDNVTLIPCRISSADGYNDYKPTPAEGEKKTAIEEKLTNYSKALGIEGLNFR